MVIIADLLREVFPVFGSCKNPFLLGSSEYRLVFQLPPFIIVSVRSDKPADISFRIINQNRTYNRDQKRT